MLLHAAIIPPRRVLDPVAELVRSVAVADPAESAPSRKGFFGRRGKGEHATDQSSAYPAAAALLELVVPEIMTIPVAAFGNVTAGDATRVAAALKAAAAGSPGAVVHIAGGMALEVPGDRNVWARLEGDLDALRSMARGVTQIVEQHGFFVDRRLFQPLLCVATVTNATTAPCLEATVAALDAFSGEPWTVDHVWLMRMFYDSGKSGSAEVDRFPLAPA